MTQIAVRNLEGMATAFQSTQLVNLRATVDHQITRVFKKIEPGAAFENLPLALFQTKLSANRQINILKALMVSPTYWDTLISAVGLSVTKQLNIYALTSDFIANGDRFSRLITRLTPTQNRIDKTFEIMNVGAIGQVDLGFAFVASSLEVVGATPTATFPTTGLIEFGAGDIGKLVTIAFVTVPVFNILKIIRTHDQPDGEFTGVIHPPYAYVMHPTLAPTLGITVPTV